jgi:hypothetical protein
MVGAVEASVPRLYAIATDRMGLWRASASATVGLVGETPNLVALDLPFPTSLTTVAGSVPCDLPLLRRLHTRIHIDRHGSAPVHPSSGSHSTEVVRFAAEQRTVAANRSRRRASD